MERDGQAKLKHQLLLHESAQMHDNIQRNLNEMYKLAGFAFPVLTGAFALAIEGKIVKAPDPALLYALFSILASLLVVSFNTIWMQLVTFTRYKYAEILTRLYALTAREGDNYGQYTARGSVLRAMIGVVIVQAILLPIVFAATYQVWHHYSGGTFAIPAYFSVVFAAITTVISWIVAAECFHAIRASIIRAYVQDDPATTK
jgi:hypothetical protein